MVSGLNLITQMERDILVRKRSSRHGVGLVLDNLFALRAHAGKDARAPVRR